MELRDCSDYSVYTYTNYTPLTFVLFLQISQQTIFEELVAPAQILLMKIKVIYAVEYFLKSTCLS